MMLSPSLSWMKICKSSISHLLFIKFIYCHCWQGWIASTYYLLLKDILCQDKWTKRLHTKKLSYLHKQMRFACMFAYTDECACIYVQIDKIVWKSLQFLHLQKSIQTVKLTFWFCWAPAPGGSLWWLCPCWSFICAMCLRICISSEINSILKIKA